MPKLCTSCIIKLCYDCCGEMNNSRQENQWKIHYEELLMKILDDTLDDLFKSHFKYHIRS